VKKETRDPKDMRDAVWAACRSRDIWGQTQAMSDARRWLRENP
jgi:predicted ATPase